MNKFTKLYITIMGSADENFIRQFLAQIGLWTKHVTKVESSNYIVYVEYPEDFKFSEILGEMKNRNINMRIVRVFKSMKLFPKYSDEPRYSFLDRVLCLISANMKKTTIRVVNNNANDWQKMLLERWQDEIDNPKKFKKLKIENKIDIEPKGKLTFHINRVGDYIITYFDKDISKFYRGEKHE